MNCFASTWNVAFLVLCIGTGLSMKFGQKIATFSPYEVEILAKGHNKTNVCGLCHLWEKDLLLDWLFVEKCIKKCDTQSVAFVAKAKNLQRQIKGQGNAPLPEILYVISDEHCDNPENFQYFKNFSLVLKNYACWNQYKPLYKSSSAEIQIVPLGYTRGYLSGNKSLSTILTERTRRKFAWGFVGHLKTNRRSMLKTFESIHPHRSITTKVSIREVLSLYRNSSFVLSGRGNRNLDCFRHYESLLAGAIPVVMGEEEEIKDTFGHFSSGMPPWVFGKTWEETKSVVKDLLNDDRMLKERQRECQQWMMREIRSIQTAVNKHASKRRN